jgi:hypothetical protein
MRYDPSVRGRSGHLTVAQVLGEDVAFSVEGPKPARPPSERADPAGTRRPLIGILLREEFAERCRGVGRRLQEVLERRDRDPPAGDRRRGGIFTYRAELTRIKG